MPVLMHQVRFRQQWLISQQVTRFAARQYFALLHYEAVIGNILNQTQIVSCGDHGLAAIAPADQQVDDLALAAGVERRGRLVEQQNFRVEHEH